MIKYVIFTNEELDAMKNGTPVMADDTFGKIAYISKDYYEKMMENARVKEVFDND